MEALFKTANDHYNKEYTRTQEIQEKLRELDEHIRSIQTHFMRIHSSGYDVTRICSVGKELIQQTSPIFSALDKMFSRAEFYKYYQMWQFRISTLVGLCILCHWIQSDHDAAQQQQQQDSSTTATTSTDDIGNLLISFTELEKLLQVNKLPNFHLTIEDYLFGLTNLSGELSRLAVNAVTRQDFKQPQRIADFLNEIYAGLRQMNLKNDALRRRFDAVKYDVKKVEDVLYDLSVRDLLQQKPTASEETSGSVSNE